MNSTGKPYAWLPGAAGTGCDTLLSQPIDLSTRLPSDSVYISFHYQLGGYGDMPEFTDKLYVEFKNNVGNWVVIKTINGQTGTVPPFVQLNLYVGAAYLGNSSFQFRFRNVSSRQGARDHWHIDYVKMDKNRHWKEPNYDDIAFSGVPASSFTNYTGCCSRSGRSAGPSASCCGSPRSR